MYNIVRIGDKNVPMMSKASVDHYYKVIFNEDPIKLQTSDPDVGAMFVFMQKMGFVMAKFAEVKESKEMHKLNEDSFYEWLDGFERTDITNALEDIQATYEGQSITHSTAKKNKEEQTEE